MEYFGMKLNYRWFDAPDLWFGAASVNNSRLFKQLHGDPRSLFTGPPIHIAVGHKSDAVTIDNTGKDAAFFKLRGECIGIPIRHPEDDNVRLHGAEVDWGGGFRNALGQQAGV